MGRLILLCLIGAVLITVSGAAASETELNFKDAKTRFLKQMRSKASSDRIEAVEALADFTQAESIELILKRGTLDPAPDVKRTSQQLLRQLAQHPSVGRWLASEMKRSLKRATLSETFPEVVRALSVTPEPQLQLEWVKALDEYLGSTKGNLLAPMTIIDDFSKQGDAEAFRAVLLFSKSKAFEGQFGYRRCVVQAMSHIKDPGAVRFLIELMSQAQGLIHHDIILYLTKLTGQKFRDDHQDWLEWWNTNADKFEFPLILPIVNDEPLDDKLPTYYGMPICAKRVVFVLDTSGSMRGAPIEAAKKALLDVIAKLPESVHFDLVLFDKSIQEWQPRLVPATESHRQIASQVVRAKGLGPGTASFAALYAAFDLEPEAIYFLSDGEPTDGSPNQIVGTIVVKNQTRRISIHTIGVVTDHSNGSGLSYFMRPLAESNYGSYHLVQ